VSSVAAPAEPRCRLRDTLEPRLPLEIEDIKRVLPHRSPFLFVDRIIEFEADKRIVGVKNVSADERYFIAGPGGVPMMPASILTEALAQTGAVLILAKPDNRSRIPYFMGIDRVRYRRPVVAGDTVTLEGIVLRLRSKMGTLRGIARVDGVVVAEGVMTFALGDPIA
jgi:3-hydroxyacyl-[acyl-carrier-protein] dehydratase